MASRKTPGARALVGALALRDGATINDAFKLAGYRLVKIGDGINSVRVVTRSKRRVTTTRHAGKAAAWLERLGRKLEALGAGKAAA